MCDVLYCMVVFCSYIIIVFDDEKECIYCEFDVLFDEFGLYGDIMIDLFYVMRVYCVVWD